MGTSWETVTDWMGPGAHSVDLYLDGTDAPDRAPDGGDLLDDDFLLLGSGDPVTGNGWTAARLPP